MYSQTGIIDDSHSGRRDDCSVPFFRRTKAHRAEAVGRFPEPHAAQRTWGKSNKLGAFLDIQPKSDTDPDSRIA